MPSCNSLNSSIPLLVRAFIYCVNQLSDPQKCLEPEMSSTLFDWQMSVKLLLALRVHVVLSCISESNFNGFLSRWKPPGLAVVKLWVRKTWQSLYNSTLALEITYTATESRECVARACMFETSPWQDTQTNLALFRLHKTKAHDSRTALSVLVSEAAAVLICVCQKAGEAYVTADVLDCQTSFPQENRKIMWWWNNLWSQSCSTRKEHLHGHISAH